MSNITESGGTTTVIGGSDTFVFQLGDINNVTPETDIIKDFRKVDGDLIHLVDMLKDYPVTGNPMHQYLQITFDTPNNKTIIGISINGDSSYDDHTIFVENIDLTDVNGTSLSTSMADQISIIDHLIVNGYLELI